ncbi:DNA/RNA non-specific endonuclease [Massilia sp. B-10]|nr:DNA/RNA non-specific endonuclease [Massilia sp. B-10]
MPSVPQRDFTECKQFFMPTGKVPVFQSRPPAKARPLCYDAFAVLHSGATKTPLYVAERINRGLPCSRRPVRNAAITSLPTPACRSRSGPRSTTTRAAATRGHMAPTANMGSAEAMAQSFSLANMVPQAPRNNSGPWAGIEKATRKYVMRASGDVYVITGPVFDDSGRSDRAGAGAGAALSVQAGVRPGFPARLGALAGKQRAGAHRAPDRLRGAGQTDRHRVPAGADRQIAPLTQART